MAIENSSRAFGTITFSLSVVCADVHIASWGIKESIYIRMHHPELNTNGGRPHQLTIWNNLWKVSCDLRSPDAMWTSAQAILKRKVIFLKALGEFQLPFIVLYSINWLYTWDIPMKLNLLYASEYAMKIYENAMTDDVLRGINMLWQYMLLWISPQLNIYWISYLLNSQLSPW